MSWFSFFTGPLLDSWLAFLGYLWNWIISAGLDLVFWGFTWALEFMDWLYHCTGWTNPDVSTLSSAFAVPFLIISWFFRCVGWESYATDMFWNMFAVIPICVSIRLAITGVSFVFRVFGWAGRLVTVGIGGGS